MSITKPQLVAIVGPTATGKTSMAIQLAKKFHGEIVSADSRQVYRGMDIGTGKASKREQRSAPHHLLDVADPRKHYNVSHFQRDATRAIKKIHQKGRLPLLVGGTGFWVEAVASGILLPGVKPNIPLRKKLAKLPILQLFQMLKRLDPQRARSIDSQNPYRLIRAIEIIRATKRPVPQMKKNPPYNVLYLGITFPQKILYQRIHQRLKKRLRQGLVAEVRRLHDHGLPWSRLEAFGLEYRFASRYLRGLVTKDQMEKQLALAIHHYAKRQLTWFKRNQRINWITSAQQAERLVHKFRNT